jgi:hypothetical protein
MSNAGKMVVIQWLRFGDIPSRRCDDYIAAMLGVAGGVHD